MIRFGFLRRSLTQLRLHPLRTGLTLLGVVFGVASVVAMVSIGEGAQREILAGIEAMGARNVHVQAKDIPPADRSEVVNDSLGLTRADATALREVVPEIDALGYRCSAPVKVSSLPGPGPELRVFGVSVELPRLHRLAVREGRMLLSVDHHNTTRVAVLGPKLADEAFPQGAVGQVIRLDSTWFEVVGVLRGTAAPPKALRAPTPSADRAPAKKSDPHAPSDSDGGGAPFDPGVYDRAVLIPFDTLTTTLSPPKVYGELDLITAEVADIAQTLPVKSAITAVLRRLHGKVDDFTIIAPEAVLRQRKATQAVLNTVLICIAAISLLVGGIGVMNIMLANIMERIPEIGLRRAVGATRGDIRRQFLGEALVICSIGGLVGIVTGLVIAFVAARLGSLPVAFAWESMVLSFGISLLVGLVFGIVPAVRAANINPIEALRNDG